MVVVSLCWFYIARLRLVLMELLAILISLMFDYGCRRVFIEICYFEKGGNLECIVNKRLLLRFKALLLMHWLRNKIRKSITDYLKEDLRYKKAKQFAWLFPFYGIFNNL